MKEKLHFIFSYSEENVSLIFRDTKANILALNYEI